MSFVDILFLSCIQFAIIARLNAFLKIEREHERAKRQEIELHKAALRGFDRGWRTCARSMGLFVSDMLDDGARHLAMIAAQTAAEKPCAPRKWMKR